MSQITFPHTKAETVQFLMSLVQAVQDDKLVLTAGTHTPPRKFDPGLLILTFHEPVWRQQITNYQAKARWDSWTGARRFPRDPRAPR